MRLDYDSGPVAGELFSFTLRGGRPPLTAVYYVGNRPYGEEVCPEENCLMELAVPVEVGGEFLRLVVTDDAGASDEFRLRIG